MENLEEMYKARLTTADELANRFESGWYIGMDIGTSQAPGIMTALANRAKRENLTGLHVTSIMDSYPFEFYTDPELNGKINGVSWFVSGTGRKAVNAGTADFIPNYYRDIPRHIRNNYHYDVACIEVAPMDKHGYFSLSAVGSSVEAVLEKADRIFVEVNRCNPRVLNGTHIHISRIDAIIEYDHDLPVIAPPTIDSVSETIGSLIAEQVPDGACVQLGIGAIPDATGLALRSKHDLGIHTEMFTDSMVSLIECGAVNNSKKEINRYKSVTTFAFGSKRIYDYIDDNPAIAILPVDYVNEPTVIARHSNFISINAALEVDLLGQVCAESVGSRQISGTGGQVDYVRGACMSPGGKSFIAFSATAKNGSISKIKSSLTPGAVVTTSKNDVDYIVTEFGIAHLRGESAASRARQLIAIAAPEYRDELTFEAKQRGLMI